MENSVEVNVVWGDNDLCISELMDFKCTLIYL